MPHFQENDIPDSEFLKPDALTSVSAGIGEEKGKMVIVIDEEPVSEEELKSCCDSELAGKLLSLNGLPLTDRNRLGAHYAGELAAAAVRTTYRRRLERSLLLPQAGKELRELRDFARATLKRASLPALVEFEEKALEDNLSKLSGPKKREVAQKVLSELYNGSRYFAHQNGLGIPLAILSKSLREMPAEAFLIEMARDGSMPDMRSLIDLRTEEYGAGLSHARRLFQSLATVLKASAYSLITLAALAGLGFSMHPILSGLIGVIAAVGLQKYRPGVAHDEEIFAAVADTLAGIAPVSSPVAAPVCRVIASLSERRPQPNSHKWVEAGNAAFALYLLGASIPDILRTAAWATYDGTTSKIPLFRRCIAEHCSRWGVTGRRDFLRLYRALHARWVIETQDLKILAQNTTITAIKVAVSEAETARAKKGSC